MTDKSQTEERGVSIPLTAGQVYEIGAPLVRNVRPLADRLRDSVVWLERDGFATSAGLAREAAAELDRLHDEVKRLRSAVVRAMDVGQQLGRCDAEIKAGKSKALTAEQIVAEVQRRFESSADLLTFSAGALWAAEKLGGAA